MIEPSPVYDQKAMNTTKNPADLSVVHYWGYAGRKMVGIPCGALETTSKATKYANNVTCPECRAILDAQMAQVVTKP